MILPVRSHPTIVRREAGGRPKEHRQARCWSQRTQRPVRYHSETREQRRLIRGRLCRRPQPRLGSAGVVQSWSLSGSGEPVLCVRAQKTSLEVGERNQADRCGLVTWIRGKQCWDCGQLHSTFTSLSLSLTCSLDSGFPSRFVCLHLVGAVFQTAIGGLCEEREDLQSFTRVCVSVCGSDWKEPVWSLAPVRGLRSCLLFPRGH